MPGNLENAITDAGRQGQRFDRSAATKAYGYVAIGLAAQLFILAGTNINQNCAPLTAARAELFQPRAGPLESPIDLKLEILQPSAGCPAHQLITRPTRNICRPVGIYLVDRPLIATQPKRQCRNIRSKITQISGKRDRPAIRENDFTLCQREFPGSMPIPHHQ